MKLLFIPGLVEAFFDGGIAIPIFGMPATFGFALGFILKAIGPALVIQLMFETQSKGLGVDKGALARPYDLSPVQVVFMALFKGIGVDNGVPL